MSIQISLSGLSFCVLNYNTNTIQHLTHNEFKGLNSPYELLNSVDYLFKTENTLKEDFDSVEVIHINELSTLVPKQLFDATSQADYLKFSSKILKSDFITHDEIAINNCVNVYVPFVNINNYIFDKFGTFNYRHFSTILIASILEITKHSIKVECYVHIGEEDHFEIIIVDKGNLLFYNTFKYNTPEDYIYYLLFTLKQLEFDPETIAISLIGDVDKNNSIYNITYKYVRFVNFGKRNDSFNYDKNPETDYSYFTLINSFTCE